MSEIELTGHIRFQVSKMPLGAFGDLSHMSLPLRNSDGSSNLGDIWHEVRNVKHYKALQSIVKLRSNDMIRGSTDGRTNSSIAIGR